MTALPRLLLILTAGALLSAGVWATGAIRPTGPAPTAARLAQGTGDCVGGDTILVTNHGASQLSVIDTRAGAIESIDIGQSPFSVVLGKSGRAYVSTAAGVSIVDVAAKTLLANIPLRYQPGSIGTGEYRPGGMGIAVSPAEDAVYVGVYIPGGRSSLEVIDLARQESVAQVEIGVRPFGVLASADGQRVWTLDHDSYNLTEISLPSLAARAIAAAPLGRGAYDKPHYGALSNDGRIWLPYQGRLLAALDTATGALTTSPLTANTHQHGVALSADQTTLYVVGTGAAGGATGGPSLSMVMLASGQETVLPLTREHEMVAVSADGKRAYLSGGYLLGGWNGITIVDLERQSTCEIAVPNLPLGIVVAP